MDTGGSDRYSDYDSPSPGSASGNRAGGGGPGKPDPCSLPVDANLEEVAISDYWVNRGTVPSAGAEALLLDTLVSGRLAVSCDGAVVGYLPVRYNYIARECLPAGVAYSGEVSESEGGAIPSVRVVLRPQ